MILCCGEALVDMIPEPTKSGRQGYVPHCGGAIFNTAIALGRLGVSTGMLTGLSTDVFGKQLAGALVHSNVDTQMIITQDRPTTLAFVELNQEKAHYTFYDENSSGRMLRPESLPELPSVVSTLFFGGISLACEPGAEAYRALAVRNSDERVVMLDPNIRAGFISDEPRYRARLDTMIARTDILKVSDEDLDWILPEPQSISEKVQILLNKGPAVVIVTRGVEGANGYLANGVEVNVPSQRVQITDTVGAGDAFNAGVIAKLAELGLLKKDKRSVLDADALRQALLYGTRVAAVTISRAGANPPWSNELSTDG